VHSVTSEAATSLSFQGAAPQRPARPDQSQANDSFGALVDSSKPVDTGHDRAASNAQQRSASQRRSDGAAASADNTRSRNATADRAARNASDDRGANAQQTSDANAAALANTNANADAAQQSKAKSSAVNGGAAKSAAESPSDNASAFNPSTDSAASAQQDAPFAATPPNPVAVALLVTIPTTDTPAAAPASGNAAAPLAAAAIAASSSAAAASPAQIKIDSDAAAAATASAADTATSSDAAAPAKIAVQVATNEAIAEPVKQQLTPADTTNAALAVTAAVPVAPKATLLKTPAGAQSKTAASGDADTASSASDSSAATATGEAAHTNVTQQIAVPSKQPAGNGIVDEAKAEGFASSTSAAAVAAHEHAAVAGPAHALTDSPDADAQATGTFQPQLPSAGATAAPAGPLSVAAATNAPVPLSGLALEIAVSARSGKSRFEIRLDPADLGRIDVRIDVDRNGHVTSHLTVEKPETLSMLRQDAPQLQRQLDDAGFKTGNGGLQFSLRDQSSSGQNNDNETGRNAQRLVISDEDAIPAVAAGRTYGRVLGSSSGVDIRV
jgi:flagellar hook-length control protein FliK